MSPVAFRPWRSKNSMAKAPSTPGAMAAPPAQASEPGGDGQIEPPPHDRMNAKRTMHGLNP